MNSYVYFAHKINTRSSLWSHILRSRNMVDAPSLVLDHSSSILYQLFYNVLHLFMYLSHSWRHFCSVFLNMMMILDDFNNYFRALLQLL